MPRRISARVASMATPEDSRGTSSTQPSVIGSSASSMVRVSTAQGSANSPPQAFAVRFWFHARRYRLACEIRIGIAEATIAGDHLAAAALEVGVDACLGHDATADGLHRAPRSGPVQAMTRRLP